MINIVIALKMEAMPIISRLSLKQMASKPYCVYRNRNIQLIVSGPGAHKAYAATSYLHAYSEPGVPAYWINLGIGGHRYLPVGCAVRAAEVSDVSARLHFTPSLACTWPSYKKPIISVAEAEQHYPEDAVYDMEAYGMLAAAAKMARMHRIQVVKIISDNSMHSAKRLRSENVKQLVLGHCEPIVEWLQQLETQSETHELEL